MTEEFTFILCDYLAFELIEALTKPCLDGTPEKDSLKDKAERIQYVLQVELSSLSENVTIPTKIQSRLLLSNLTLLILQSIRKNFSGNYLKQSVSIRPVPPQLTLPLKNDNYPMLHFDYNIEEGGLVMAHSLFLKLFQMVKDYRIPFEYPKMIQKMNKAYLQLLEFASLELLFIGKLSISECFEKILLLNPSANMLKDVSLAFEVFRSQAELLRSKGREECIRRLSMSLSNQKSPNLILDYIRSLNKEMGQSALNWYCSKVSSRIDLTEDKEPNSD